MQNPDRTMLTWTRSLKEKWINWSGHDKHEEKRPALPYKTLYLTLHSNKQPWQEQRIFLRWRSRSCSYRWECLSVVAREVLSVSGTSVSVFMRQRRHPFRLVALTFFCCWYVVAIHLKGWCISLIVTVLHNLIFATSFGKQKAGGRLSFIVDLCYPSPLCALLLVYDVNYCSTVVTYRNTDHRLWIRDVVEYAFDDS